MATEMRCVKFDKDKKSTYFTMSRVPLIGSDNDVIVKVEMAGICATDFDVVQGTYFAVDNVILGHEVAGTVYKISESCKNKPFNEGERVLVISHLPCGITKDCETSDFIVLDDNEEDRCYEVGQTDDGGWAEYCRVNSSQLVAIPNCIEFKHAILCDPLSRVLHALDSLGPDLEKSSGIAIIGAGLLGMMFACVLHVRGYTNVAIIEQNPFRRLIFAKLETEYPCVSWKKLDSLEKKNPDLLFQYCIDCTGDTEAIKLTLTTLVPGAVLLICGLPKPTSKISMSFHELIQMQYVIRASSNNTKQSIQQAFNMIKELSERYINEKNLHFKYFLLNDHETALTKKYTVMKHFFTVQDPKASRSSFASWFSG